MKKLLNRLGSKGSKKEPESAQPGQGAVGGAVVGYDIREKDLPKLHKAAWNGDIAKVKQLTKKDPSALDKENRTALHLACVRGHTQVVQELLEWNARTNVGDNQAKTPLMKAVECNQEVCVQLLVEYRADIDATDREGDTGLHHAVRNGNATIVNTLIKGGANLNHRNRLGSAPLHLSVLGKSEEISRLLLTNKADVNIEDSNSRTPLMHSCLEGYINQVKLLLEFKANTYLKDNKGWTAEDCAMMKAHHGCSQLVYDYNLKLRQRTTPGSIASTPRSSSHPVSAGTTPRDKTESDFGIPAGQADTDSGDETLSKISAPGDRDNSWADDTDISQAVEDRKKHYTFDDSDIDGDFEDEVAQPKISLAKNVNLESDEEGGEGSNPGSRAGSESIRVVNTRIPTPTDSNRSPNVTPSPKPSTPTNSKIPLRQSSGRSHTSIEDNWSDTEPAEELVGQKKSVSRVSFKSDHEISEVRDITSDDNTDIDDDDDDEDIVARKRRRMESQPHEAIETPPVPLGAYTPNGVGQLKDTDFNSEKYRAMMDSLGLQDIEVSDSEASSVDPPLSPTEPNWKPSEPSTPRQGILKVKTDTVKPVLKKQQGQESDLRPVWDSDSDNDQPQDAQIVVEAEINYTKPSMDSAADKKQDDLVSQGRGDHAGDHDDSGHSPPLHANSSSSLADAGHPVNSMNTDSQTQSAVTAETVKLVKHSKKRSEDKEEESDWDSTRASERPVSPEYDSDLEGTLNPERSNADDKDETDHEIEEISNQHETLAGDMQESTTSEFVYASTTPEYIPGGSTTPEGGSVQQDLGEGEGVLFGTVEIRELNESTDWSHSIAIENAKAATLIRKGSADGKGKKDKSDDETESNEGVEDEVRVDVRDVESEDENIEKIDVAADEYDIEEDTEEVVDDVKEGISIGDVRNTTIESEAKFKVMDPKLAPKCVLEYEPSDASDMTETPSIQEEIDAVKKKKMIQKGKQLVAIKLKTPLTAESTPDKEVARVLAVEEPSSGYERYMVPTEDDFHRHSVDPQTQDTMDDQMSIEEETSQWSSTDENFTPRTPRDAQNIISDKELLDFDEDEEEDIEEVDERIEEAVTSFKVTSPVSSLQPRDTEEIKEQTPAHSLDTSGSGSGQKTVVETPHQGPVNPKGQKNEESESEWDSEDEGGPSDPADLPPVYGIAEESPRVADQTLTTTSDVEEEEESDWEVERRKEKEWFENRRQQQEETNIQGQWEVDERRKAEELKREAAEELEHEKAMLRSKGDSDADEDISEAHSSQDQDFSLNAEDSTRAYNSSHLSPRHHSGASNTSPRTRELKKPPPKLVVKKFITSPRETILNPAVKTGQEVLRNRCSVCERVLRDKCTACKKALQTCSTFICFDNASKYKNGEIENESPIPVIQAGSPNMIRIYGKDDDDLDEEEEPEIPELEEFLTKPDDPVMKESLTKPDVPELDQFLMDNQPESLAKPIEAETVVPVKSSSVQSSFDNQDLPVPEPSSLPPPPPTQDATPAVTVTSDLGGHQGTSLTQGVKAMSLRSDGGSMDDEDSIDDLDSPRNRPDATSYLPGLYGNSGLYNTGLDVAIDDDGLSVTSTENGDISSSYRPENLPYGKDMLVNMNLSDSSAVLKLQEHLREHRRQLENERSQKMLIENKQKLLVKEKSELQKRIDTVNHQKSALEQTRLDLEAKIRNLEYNLNEEEEKRKNAELLLSKTKEHLAKKEEQFTSEMEQKQKAELTMRNIHMELRAAHNQIKELEEEKDELERLLTNERNARQLQEKINDEQQRLQQHVHEEAVKTSSQREDAQNRLEMADDDISKAYENAEKLRNEIVALKAELQRQRVRLTEENNILSSENESMQTKIEDLKSEVKLQEEALTTASMQHNMQMSNSRSESVTLSNLLEKEKVLREKIEAELESVKTRLQSTSAQLDKAQQARNEFERRLHSDREEWARHLERKDQELNAVKESTQTLLQKLNSTETKLNAVENELHVANAAVLERSSQYQQVQRDLQYYKTAQENHDHSVKHEKEQNAKLLGKVESLQDRISSLQHDNLTLKQQVDTANLSLGDRSGQNFQDNLSSVVAGIKSDHEKARLALEEKNTTLSDSISRLREDLRNSDNKRNSLEQDLRRLNQEYNDVVRKLSVAEATLDVASKARDSLEHERGQMKLEMEKLQQRYNTAQEKTIEAQARMGELVDRLDRAEQSTMRSNQQLADTSATMQAYTASKSELEDSYQKLQVENVRLDAELKHEKQKCEMLQRDLQDSTKVRSSLEALCSNLKSTNAHLEEKLGPEHVEEVTAAGETMTRSLLAQEAEETKELWEKEVISRSKLGLRIAQLDRQKQETAAHIEEEKRKTRKALEQKKLAESKLESEQEKTGQLQKEVANLKAYLKVAKKRLKALDSNENRFSSLNSAFDKERVAMEEMLISVKAQLEEMKLQMQGEVDEKARIQQQNIQLESELKSLKKIERSVKKINQSKQKLEREFETYKNTVETGYTDKATVEEMKKEIEAKYRLELNRKLDEVNNYLEEQARTRNRLDTSRDEQESRLRNEKKRLEEELTDLRIRYEQSQAQRETKELECKRYRDLYESEMQWRMRLSEQLYHSTDKAFTYKNNSERQRSRMYGSLNNLSVNGHNFDVSRINSALSEDPLSNKLRAELDRSIAKHLEAAPHDQIRPITRNDAPVLAPSSFAKSNADYIELLKRKYCV